ncbi:MAG: suppressor of fused domain protein [Steroidobacteraceae bacterium]
MRGIFVTPQEMFADTFSQKDVDTGWSHCGAFEYAPTSARPSWLYVTSGMSAPWDAEEADPNAVSGLGWDFIFESSVQGDWAIRRLLQLMGYQILLCHGRYPGRDPLGVFVRLPLRGPIWDADSDVQFLMIAPPDSSTGTQQLESGSFELLPMVGVTNAEVAFARVQGGEALLERLRAAGAFPVTDPRRQTVSLGS